MGKLRLAAGTAFYILRKQKSFLTLLCLEIFYKSLCVEVKGETFALQNFKTRCKHQNSELLKCS